MSTIFGGPRTQKGKAIAARNATTHGLFSRNVVLPHLGEDPRGYNELLDLLQAQINPRTAAELYYVERVAEATWQQRRLARWEAQIWENDGLDEDHRLTKIERVQKLQITLGRRVDRAFQMLAKTLPQLSTARAREDILQARGLTNVTCKDDKWQGRQMEQAVRDHVYTLPWPEMDLTILDNAPAVSEVAAADAPAAETPAAETPAAEAPPSSSESEKTQNEPRISTYDLYQRALAEDPGCSLHYGPEGVTITPSRHRRKPPE